MKAMRFGPLIGITLESKMNFSECSSSDLEPWNCHVSTRRPFGVVQKRCGRRRHSGSFEF